MWSDLRLLGEITNRGNLGKTMAGSSGVEPPSYPWFYVMPQETTARS